MDDIAGKIEIVTAEYIPTTLISVDEVHATNFADHYQCLITINTNYGVQQIMYASNPTDPYGLGPAVRQWLIDNEGSYVIIPYVAPPPSPYTFQVATLWGRLTDDEAEEFDTASMTASPLKMRKQFLLAVQMNSDSELFAWLLALLTSLFGATRAAALLVEGN